MILLNTLSNIGNKLKNKEIICGIGGSLLLSFYELIDNPNDIDILVSENHANELNEIMTSIGMKKKVIRTAPFRTKYFSKYLVNNTEIDIMGGFAIEHEKGIYTLPIEEESIVGHQDINGVDIPLCSLEDWYILYWLIPGKQEKAIIIENYLKTNGVKHASLLEKAIKQTLPKEVKERVLHLLDKQVI